MANVTDATGRSMYGAAGSCGCAAAADASSHGAQNERPQMPPTP